MAEIAFGLIVGILFCSIAYYSMGQTTVVGSVIAAILLTFGTMRMDERFGRDSAVSFAVGCVITIFPLRAYRKRKETERISEREYFEQIGLFEPSKRDPD